MLVPKSLDWETDGLDWPWRANSHLKTISDVRWHWQRFNGPGKPKLLLLHGTGASAHTWAPLIPLLMPEFDLLALDLPGQAFSHCSEPDKMSMTGMAQCIAELLSDQNFAPAVVVGHSAGAALAARMALRGLISPTRIIAIAPALMPWEGLAQHLFTPMAKMIAGSSFMPRIFSRMSGSQESVQRLITRIGSDPVDEMVRCYQALVGNEVHVANTFTMMARWDLPSLTPELPSLAVPIDLVVGATDKAVPPEQARQAAKLLPHARMHWLHGKGHLVHEEQPQAVARIISESL